MNKIAELEIRKTLIIQRPQFQPFEVMRYIDPSSFKKVESAWLEYGSYTVGNRDIIGLVRVRRGKAVEVTLRPAPGVQPMEAVEDEDIREVIRLAREKVAKKQKGDSVRSMPLAKFIKGIQSKGTQGKTRALGGCFQFYFPFVGCYAMCCDVGLGKPKCWWVCFK